MTGRYTWRHRLLEDAPVLGAGLGLFFPFIFFGLAVAGLDPTTIPVWLAIVMWTPMEFAFFLTGPAGSEGVAPTSFVVLVVMLYNLFFCLCGLVSGFLLRALVRGLQTIRGAGS